ncbi:MAG: GNAT family N-acetyltransferase [Clostridia bacterium]|jgi:ribosomal protein S18 acetylase RimI-like enzyme
MSKININNVIIQKLHIGLEKDLFHFFNSISLEDQYNFHPHDFSYIKCVSLCKDPVDDYYCVVMLDDTIIGYGMLRGIDDGYKIPSVGLIISCNFRGCGLSKILLNHLHIISRNKGFKQIMLKVNMDNNKAIMLYKTIGYKLKEYDNTQYVGFYEL